MTQDGRESLTALVCVLAGVAIYFSFEMIETYLPEGAEKFVVGGFMVVSMAIAARVMRRRANVYPTNHLAIATQMIAHYNAQDADAYVALMTNDAAEAGYRGVVLRDGKEGVRSGLKAMFAEFPENRADIITGYQLGDFAVLHEKVYRSAAAEPFEVMSIYSFEGDKCSRVEFVR